MELPTAN